MSSTKTHNRISELIQLIEINHNRMVLNESSFNLDVAQLRSHVLELYTCLDQLTLSKESGKSTLAEKEETPKKEDRQEVQHITISEPLTNVEHVPEVPNIVVPEVPIAPAIPPIQTPRFTPEPIVKEEMPPAEEPVPTVKPEVQIEEIKPEPPKEIIQEVVTREPVVEESPVVKVVTPTELPKPEPVVPEPVIAIPEVPKVVIPEPVKEIPKTAPVVETPVVEKPTPPTRPEKRPALEGDVFEQLRKKKLDSIKKGISIGKRYEIQNALFENEAEAYNHAIEQLDNSEDLNNASHLLSAYAKRYDWDPESALVDELFQLLQRRYID